MKGSPLGKALETGQQRSQHKSAGTGLRQQEESSYKTRGRGETQAVGMQGISSLWSRRWDPPAGDSRGLRGKDRGLKEWKRFEIVHGKVNRGCPAMQRACWKLANLSCTSLSWSHDFLQHCSATGVRYEENTERGACPEWGFSQVCKWEVQESLRSKRQRPIGGSRGPRVL